MGKMREIRLRFHATMLARFVLVGLIFLTAARASGAQRAPLDRLSMEQFDVRPPTASVTGAPGAMRVGPADCRDLPLSEVRRRVVDVAVQEWAFFGFSTVDQTEEIDAGPGAPRTRRRRSWLGNAESVRVSDSIAGYWSATPEGQWIVDRQNDRWNGSAGTSTRWRDPWSAAFISWVMCEGGLGERRRFQRAIAHVTYIDQAIRARDGNAPQAAFTAYDAGEADVVPGDMLCTGSRPRYQNLAQRRRQLGVGARSHCDIVVKVDPAAEQILAIGGNVRGRVSLKILPIDERARPIARGGRPVFAHLKLDADPIALDAMDASPTVRAIGCGSGLAGPFQLAAAASLTIALLPPDECREFLRE